MNEIEAILLGIVQGATEFLPISSSGHLILVPWLADIRYLQEHPDFNKTFDVALHFGTLIGVLAYFWRELAQVVAGGLNVVRTRRAEAPRERMALVLVIGTIPAVIVGGLGEDYIDEHLGEPWQIAIFLVIFGLLLAWADRRPGHRDLESVGLGDAVKVGVAQALALAPGVSRSGVTITAGRALGLDRDAAARLSFLLLVPATLGAVVYKGAGVAADGFPEGQVVPVLLGVIASAISGFAAIAGLLAFVRRRSYDIFVVYRLIAAAVIVLLIATGVKSATF